MAWTYSGDPSASALDEIRFLIGDTVATNSWTLQDAEINYTIGQFPDNVCLAAAVCAESIVAKFKSGLVASKSVGDLSISYSQQSLTMFQDAAYRLRQRAALAAVIPYAGGTSLADKEAEDADTDRVQPAVKVDGMDYVKNGSTSNNWGV